MSSSFLSFFAAGSSVERSSTPFLRFAGADELPLLLLSLDSDPVVEATELTAEVQFIKTSSSSSIALPAELGADVEGFLGSAEATGAAAAAAGAGAGDTEGVGVDLGGFTEGIDGTLGGAAAGAGGVCTGPGTAWGCGDCAGWGAGGVASAFTAVGAGIGAGVGAGV